MKFGKQNVLFPQHFLCDSPNSGLAKELGNLKRAALGVVVRCGGKKNECVLGCIL